MKLCDNNLTATRSSLMQIFYNTPHIVEGRLHNKENNLFRTVWAVFAIVFCYFVEFMRKMTVYAFHRPNYTLFPL